VTSGDDWRTFYYLGGMEGKSRKPVPGCRFLVLSEVPIEELAEGCTAVAVYGLFFRSQFGEGFLNRRKIEERVVAESI
jgi:hypothetical protein